MAEENTGAMNFDLNLGPVDNSSDDDDSEPASGSFPNVAMNLEDWLDSPVHRFREAVRHRNQRWRSLFRQLPIPSETRNLALELIGNNMPQVGEGSVPTEKRPTEAAKTCENGTGFMEDETLGKKKDGGKNNVDEGSFFDCNICLDLAKDPVVTCCGHLFCWPCLYRWLHNHSDAKECPVCKGEVTTKNVTPIYGRGNNTREPDMDSSQKIPLRPPARRIESWRQAIQRTTFTIPMEEMIRRLGNTFDLSRELAQIQSRNSDSPRESPERSNVMLNRILTSRGIRRERTPVPPSDDVIDLTETSPPIYEARDNRSLSSLLLRRSNSHRAAILSNLTSAINSAESLAAERLVESYFHSNPVERNQELPLPVDDRDSVSSIAKNYNDDHGIIMPPSYHHHPTIPDFPALDDQFQMITPAAHAIDFVTPPQDHTTSMNDLRTTYMSTEEINNFDMQTPTDQNQFRDNLYAMPTSTVPDIDRGIITLPNFLPSDEYDQMIMELPSYGDFLNTNSMNYQLPSQDIEIPAEDQYQSTNSVEDTQTTYNDPNTTFQSNFDVVNDAGDLEHLYRYITGEEYSAVLPVGYRFLPTDGELVVEYLNKLVNEEPLPPSDIYNIDVYDHSPQQLSEIAGPNEDNEWYFFTPYKRKSKGGIRIERSTPNGYWKATKGDEPVTYNGQHVGNRKVLVYYDTQSGSGKKTKWIMHEYRLKDAPPHNDNMVVCRIHKHTRGNKSHE